MKKKQLLTLFITVLTFSTLIAQDNALNFDGDDDNVEVFTNINIPISNSNYTIEAWIRPSGLSPESGSYGIVGWGEYGTANGTNAFRLGNNDRLANYWWANDLIVINNFENDIWIHVAATYNGTLRTLYINGEIVAGDTPANPNNTISSDNLTIGLAAPMFNEYFQGSIDELRIWNVSRTQSEIQESRLIELTGNETGLVAYYNFNQGVANGDNSTITTLEDSSSSGNDGDLQNFTLNGDTSNWVTGVDFSTLSVETNSINKNKIKLFPNPTPNLIQVTGVSKPEKYIIYDAIGKEINEGLISENTVINVEKYSKGIYFLKIGNGNTISFIKE